MIRLTDFGFTAPERGRTRFISIRQNCLRFLVERDRYYPIFLMIISCLDIHSIVSLTRTCKSLSGLYNELVPLLWDANRSLTRYVKDPKAFRSQLALGNALISGSFVVQFLDRVEYPDADLDIFVQSETGLYTAPDVSLIKHLVEKEGYILKAQPKTDIQYERLDGFKVHTLTRPRPDKYLGAFDKIQVIVSPRRPSYSIITSFWCTTVMNVMSWNKVYSIYANDTFIKRKLYPTNCNQRPATHSALRKYVTRGWQLGDVACYFSSDDASDPNESSVSDEVSSVEGTSISGDSPTNEIPFSWEASPKSTQSGPSNPFKGVRMFGDSRTWQICLNIEGVTQSPFPDGINEAVSWSTQPLLDVWYNTGEPPKPGAHGVDLKSFLYRHPCLKHIYLFAREDESTKHSWARQCTDELDRALSEQSELVDSSAWAAFLSLMLSLPTSRRDTHRVLRRMSRKRMPFTVKDEFQYYDDMLVGWFKRWKNGEKNWGDGKTLGGFDRQSPSYY